MANSPLACAEVDVVVLSRRSGALAPAVEQGLQTQSGVRLRILRVVGDPQPSDGCRWQTIETQSIEVRPKDYLAFIGLAGALIGGAPGISFAAGSVGCWSNDRKANRSARSCLGNSVSIPSGIIESLLVRT